MVQRFHHGIFIVGLMAIAAVACKKGSAVDNLPPDTKISLDRINLSGENRLNSLLSLHWWGADPDGVVAGYEISLDNETWDFTERQDSTFLFSITSGSDTVDIDLWIRAIDLDGAVDPSPAYLKIPLRNTPPEAYFNKTLIPNDTAFRLVSLTWSLSDLDGIATIQSVELKVNDGEWVEISPLETVACLVPQQPSASGQVVCNVFNSNSVKLSDIQGLQLNQKNSFYIRATDIAGSKSKIDTIADLYVQRKTNDLLVIGAVGSAANGFYATNLDAVGAAYDFIDFTRENAKNQPRIWSPTLGHLLGMYDRVLINSNEQSFKNAQTNAEDILLELASTAILSYTENGGKLWISSSFPNAFSTGSALFGILPIDSFSTSAGQARFPIDSLAIGQLGYPDLTCSAFISGLDPFYPSSDAQQIYQAQLTKNNGWEGPKVVGVRRQISGKTSFVFHSIELHKVNNDALGMEQLFAKILNDEFNW